MNLLIRRYGMSKHVKGQDTQGEETSMSQAMEEEVSQRKVDTSRLSDLFAQYREADEEVAEAERMKEAAVSKRSRIVKEISEAVGGKKVRYRGDKLTIVQRGETWFFRGRERKEEDGIVEVE